VVDYYWVDTSNNYCDLTPITLLLTLPPNLIINNNVLAQPHPSIASTCNFFDVDTGSTKEVGDLPSALSILNINSCPSELGIYVHGWRATEEDAEEQTQGAFLSLQKSGYPIPVIGFSWDSNTLFSPDGWEIAKRIANENGHLLAQFIANFKSECQNAKLRIIVHSLGSRVTLSAIESLYDNFRNTTDISEKITSVHLLGAALTMNKSH
jgi:esterase/lipase superfamily enzyme